jgi:hypothetical protein
MSALSVVTKRRDVATFGNDGENVDTKVTAGGRFGNYSLGFIRIRKRKLKGGRHGWRAKASSSFDLVRAVRVDDKPRHRFVLGLGSQKEYEHYYSDHYYSDALLRFWAFAISGMKRHGLTDAQRHHVLAEMVRKGARLPTLAECHRGLYNVTWTPTTGTNQHHRGAYDGRGAGMTKRAICTEKPLHNIVGRVS